MVLAFIILTTLMAIFIIGYHAVPTTREMTCTIPECYDTTKLFPHRVSKQYYFCKQVGSQWVADTGYCPVVNGVFQLFNFDLQKCHSDAPNVCPPWPKGESQV